MLHTSKSLILLTALGLFTSPMFGCGNDSPDNDIPTDESKPEDPKTDPEDPKTDPEDPKIDPEDPKTDPEDPKTDPEDPKTDTDGDGIADESDNCAATANPDQADTDDDGIGDACDNCKDVKNPDQADDDQNGIGNACEPEKSKFQAGFARTDITPTLSLPLRGYGNTMMRMSKGYLDHLYANCIALTDENGATVLLFMNDLIGAGSYFTKGAIESIVKTTGIPEENIFIQGSHTHSAPDGSQTSYSGIKYYNARLAESMTQAAVEALADRAPATIKTGNTEIEGLNFVRHYLLQDGTYGGDNFGNFDNNPIVKHETEADHTLQMLVFERQEAKDIMVLNFQTHPHRTGGSKKTDVSSDIVGQVRENVERDLGVWSTYLQGAAGNINPISRIESENRTKDYKEWGILFTQSVKDCYKNKMKSIQTGNLNVTKYEYHGKINHSEDSKVDVAQIIRKDWTEDGVLTEESKKLMAENDIHSAYHAGSIINKSKYTDEKDGVFNISTLGFGDVGIACAPFELFDVNGEYIKKNSKFGLTLIMGYCNGSMSYLPADYSYDNTSYEVDQCRFEKGTAEKLASQFVTLLNDYQDTPATVDYTVKVLEKEPVTVSHQVYWNLDFDQYHSGMGKARPEKSGKYEVRLVGQDGKIVTKVFASKELAQAFDKHQLGSIGETDGVVTQVGSVEDAGFELIADNYWVNYYDKDSITVNSSPKFNGIEQRYQITDKTMRILTQSDKKVEVTDRFRTNDRAWIVSDVSGNAVAAFITNREANSDAEEEHYSAPITSHCRHCDKTVDWTNWYDNTTLPTAGGHYRLMRNGELTGQMSMSENAHICLDFNGHTYTGAEDHRIYSLHNPGTVLALMDNSKQRNGGLKAAGQKTSAQGTVVWARYGEAYFYDGIYDASAIENDYSGTVFEGAPGTKAFIYGGKFLGGKSYYGTKGGYGGTISVKGECTIYDGEFTGGYAATSDKSKNGYGGVVSVSTTGLLNIHGGKFTGGKSDRLGGCICVLGTMTMDGGEVYGCDSATGKVLYVATDAKATISGGHVDGSQEGNIVSKGTLTVTDPKYTK